jgi:hypothetical protein
VLGSQNSAPLVERIKDGKFSPEIFFDENWSLGI